MPLPLNVNNSRRMERKHGSIHPQQAHSFGVQQSRSSESICRKSRIGIQTAILLCVFVGFFSIALYLIVFDGKGDDTIDVGILGFDPGLAIFYNAFLPTTEDPREDAKVIIHEQMTLLAEAEHLAKSQFFYSYISGNVSEQLGICDGEYIPTSRCTEAIRAEKGNEVDTVQLLYDYCLEFPYRNVIYMHNKGSFHPSEYNTNLRWMHNHALLETHVCYDAIVSRKNADCNVCSARFSTLPHMHTSGNMWMARCSYIAQLHPPLDFPDIMDRLIVKPMNSSKELYERLLPNCKKRKRIGSRLCEHDSFFGFGRFAVEHWVHSHPAIMPCDVYPKVGPTANSTSEEIGADAYEPEEFVWGYDNVPDETSDWEPELHYGPRLTLTTYRKNNSIYNFKNIPWLEKEGRLFEYSQLYGQAPPNHSWFWDWYE